MNLRKYRVPEIVYGDNSIGLAAKFAKNFNANKILLVTDSGVQKAGWVKELEESLQENQLNYIIYNNITPNPKDYEVNEGAKLYIKEKCNLIIAIGGGSVIDCAKGIGIVCTNGKDINEFEGVDNIRVPMTPLICIPTTAGSSADISQFAIILNTHKQKKIAIISKALVPDVAIIDAITTTSMDAELTTNTGIDALVHAIEAYVSNASSVFTNINALKAIELLSNNLLTAVNEPYNVEARNNVMKGSMLAGIAFSNASLGIIHAMAHSLGGLKDLPHGECNAILMDYCIDFNFESCPEKFKDIYISMGGDIKTPDDQIKAKLTDKVKQLARSLGVATSFNHYNVEDINIEQITTNAFYDPCIATNPRVVELEDIKKLFTKLLY
ncbi:iron-containing alcohol dehydrogenase [Carboxylicivirga caseinilyticus]|uniref:iron-containing alcohol dehydrogenase n=1 Tax=Carboxylicivirga caseinilyticus TaxID=3417572 RepID=UPI003D332B07|nr:iron-containing alcohol dehydrogenase [Marinilabiliaceae bacterium A049]